MYGKASFDRSSGVRRESSSRERGPWTVSSVRAEVMSTIDTCSPSARWRSSQAIIRRWITSAPITRYESSPKRVTVTSVQMPARSVSHCV